MTHLVTGGNGFLGAFISRKLISMGEAVRSIDIAIPENQIDGVEYHAVDVLDRERLKSIMRGVSYVHHNAALVPLRKSGNLFQKVNVNGTKNVLDSAIEAGVEHFSHMSSSAIYGSISESDCPIDQNTRLRPVEIYGQSKLDAEKIVADELCKDRISVSIIRPRTIIGTERLGIFQILFEWISEGRNIYIIGSGKNVFQFAHVSDLVDVSIETSMKRLSGFFNIGTDKFGSLREVLESLCEFADTGSKVISLPQKLTICALWLADKLRLSPLAPWHYMTYHKPFFFDLSSEKERLEWRPKYSNNEMIIASYKWYLNNKGSFKSRKNSSTHRGKVNQGIIRVLKWLS